jgi:hypothetical protein
MHEKLKSWLADDTIFIAILLVLIGVVSFGLGRLSVGEGSSGTAVATPRVQLVASSTVLVPKSPVASSTVGQANGAAVITAPVPTSASKGPYVGSKSGSKYYLTSCSGAKRIKDANKVIFATKQDAAAAGYEPASNCPGI